MALTLSINYLYMLIATIASFIFGWLWYGKIFGKLWLKLSRKNPKGKKPKPSEMLRSMFLNFVGTFIMVYIFATLIFLTGLGNISGVIMLSILIWLGFFVSTTLLGNVLWDMKPWKLFFLNSTYWLLNLIIVGTILVSF